jgi:hypothetical protein
MYVCMYAYSRHCTDEGFDTCCRLVIRSAEATSNILVIQNLNLKCKVLLQLLYVSMYVRMYAPSHACLVLKSISVYKVLLFLFLSACICTCVYASMRAHTYTHACLEKKKCHDAAQLHMKKQNCGSQTNPCMYVYIYVHMSPLENRYTRTYQR